MHLDIHLLIFPPKIDFQKEEKEFKKTYFLLLREINTPLLTFVNYKKKIR